MTKDICGSTNTSTNKPCQWNEAEKGECPWHSEEKDPDTRSTELEENPEIIEVVAACLNNGDTVTEACAEASISENQYYEWRDRGKEEDEGVFSEFSKETAQAREIAGKNDRLELRAYCKQTDDTRTWYKLHMNQYGDRYGDEDTDMRDTERVVIHTDEQSTEIAKQN